MKKSIQDYKSENLKRLMQDFIEEKGLEDEFNEFVKFEYFEYLNLERTERRKKWKK